MLMLCDRGRVPCPEGQRGREGRGGGVREVLASPVLSLNFDFGYTIALTCVHVDGLTALQLPKSLHYWSKVAVLDDL